MSSTAREPGRTRRLPRAQTPAGAGAPPQVLLVVFLAALVPFGLGCSSKVQGQGDTEAASRGTSDDCPVGSPGCPCTVDGGCASPFSCDPNLHICASCNHCLEDRSCPGSQTCHGGCCGFDGGLGSCVDDRDCPEGFVCKGSGCDYEWPGSSDGENDEVGTTVDSDTGTTGASTTGGSSSQTDGEPGRTGSTTGGVDDAGTSET